MVILIGQWWHLVSSLKKVLIQMLTQLKNTFLIDVHYGFGINQSTCMIIKKMKEEIEERKKQEYL